MKTFRRLLLELAAAVTDPEEIETHYEHAGDAHFNDGLAGAASMVDSFRSIIADAPRHLGTKIDGSPSMFYGVENGRHWISYKGRADKTKSFTHEDIEAFHPDANGKDKSGFRATMHAMLDHVGRIHSGVEGEVHQGDIMWHAGRKPETQMISGVPHYTFKPNVIRNAIPVDSEEGRKIGEASFGFAPHTVIRDGVQSNFTSKQEQQHPDIHLMDTSAPAIPEEHQSGLHERLKKLEGLIASTPGEHFDYVSRGSNVELFKRYTSRKRMEGSQDSIGFDDFVSFTHAHLQKGMDKLKSAAGKAKAEANRKTLLDEFATHREHIESGLRIHREITGLGNSIRSILDSQHDTKRYFDKEGGLEPTNVEGYVFKPAKRLSSLWYKLVDPTFTARNFANRPRPGAQPVVETPPQNVTEETTAGDAPVENQLTRTGNNDHAVVSFGRGMGHIGHMYLASSVITHAADVGGDPYVVLSKTVGPDDPLTAEEKIDIHKTVFPHHAEIFQPATKDMPSMFQVVSHLRRLGYKKLTVIVGADQKETFEKIKLYNKDSVNQKTGTHVPGYGFDELNVISRHETSDPSRTSEGPRATPLRDAIMSGSPADEVHKQWRDAFHPAITDEKLKGIMATVKERLTTFNAPKPKKTKKLVDHFISRLLGYIAEDGEGGGGGEGGMTTSSGIAGLGDDAREGNVVVRKKLRMFRRRKQR